MNVYYCWLCLKYLSFENLCNSLQRNDYFSGVLKCNVFLAFKFQYIIPWFDLCWSFDYRKCSDFSMNLVLKNIFITEIFKYFIMTKVSLCSDCVFRLWYKTKFLDIALDSKWNILSHHCFCCLFSLLVWMYWFWIRKYIWTGHRNSFDIEYFTWKTGSSTEKDLEKRVFIMYSFFRECIAFPKFFFLKSFQNSDWHYSIEMSIFVVCWILMFCGHLNSNA